MDQKEAGRYWNENAEAWTLLARAGYDVYHTYAMISAGFTIEYVNEPFPDNEMVKKIPSLQDAQLVAYFLHIRCRKGNPVK
jgi:hypothetical protein